MIRSGPNDHPPGSSLFSDKHRMGHVLQSVPNQAGQEHVQEDAGVRILPRRFRAGGFSKSVSE
jgi:hypothetical protein